MSTKHTPGPWSIVQSKRDLIVAEDGSRVGEATSLSAADARLIAAAPEMFQALLVIAENGPVGAAKGDSRHNQTNKLLRAVKLARAAIAKATGGAA